MDLIGFLTCLDPFRGGYGGAVTNFPGISVDSNRLNCLVEKTGLGVEPRRLLSPVKQV